MIRAAYRRLRRFRRGDEGSATIEFVLLFPFFIMVFSSAFEAAYVTIRQAMLDRALDMTVRELRLGIMPNPTHALVKARVCNLAGIFPDCMNTLHIDLEVVSTTSWNMTLGAVSCVDTTNNITPTLNFTNGQSNELMLITACAVFKPMVPTTGLGLKLPRVNGGDDYAVVSISAFVNEPA